MFCHSTQQTINPEGVKKHDDIVAWEVICRSINVCFLFPKSFPFVETSFGWSTIIYFHIISPPPYLL